jgi:hypothetical protein
VAWRKRVKGRKRKLNTPRYPSGQVRHERIAPPPEVVARREALFGDARVQGDPCWLIDVLWAGGELDDRARHAAIRFNAMMRALRRRVGAPDLTTMRFHDARGSVNAAGAASDSAALDAEVAAAVQALKALGLAAAHVTVQAVCYDRVESKAPIARDPLPRGASDLAKRRRAAEDASLLRGQDLEARLLRPERVALIRMGLAALAAHFAHGARPRAKAAAPAPIEAHTEKEDAHGAV